MENFVLEVAHTVLPLHFVLNMVERINAKLLTIKIKDYVASHKNGSPRVISGLKCPPESSNVWADNTIKTWKWLNL